MFDYSPIQAQLGHARHTAKEREAAAVTFSDSYLKIGKRAVYRLAQAGVILTFGLGGLWRFRSADLDRWVAVGINVRRAVGRVCMRQVDNRIAFGYK